MKRANFWILAGCFFLCIIGGTLSLIGAMLTAFGPAFAWGLLMILGLGLYAAAAFALIEMEQYA